MYEDTATRLLGLPGMRVVEVDDEANGGLTVYVESTDAAQASCPICGMTAHSMKETMPVSVRDVTFGDRQLTVVWLKRRLVCPSPGCPQRTFVETLPEIAPRRRTTNRLRRLLGRAIAEQGRTVTEVANSHHVSWHTAHRAFADHVDPTLDCDPAPVRVLGIDEVRRGRPRWRQDPTTGQTTPLADRWHTGFTDLSGTQGILGHVAGRTKADVITWLRRQPTAWPAGIQLVSTDLCAAFRAAVRVVLPHAALCADPFHLVQLANRAVTAVRQRLTREHYGRRVRKTDPEYGIKRLLLRNLEDLTDDQHDKLWNVLADQAHLVDLALTWIAKEDLRDILAPRANRGGRQPTEAEATERWDAFHAWCEANQHIPEPRSLQQTLTKWRQEIFNAVLTGASNAGSEGVNRIQKLDSRAAFGYLNPTNQQRRARVATLRSRQRSHNVTPHRTQTVVETYQVPA
ncbi:MAG: ISL3 family transposase [Dactylosporangium sp.]|nr:ISL3 family transposase [Dactylosporangium sp.]NNJ62257.1 ISL3 family transposase [Dactylosporangium sp.]